MSEVETESPVMHEEKGIKCDKNEVKHENGNSEIEEKSVEPENDNVEKEEKPVKHEKEEMEVENKKEEKLVEKKKEEKQVENKNEEKLVEHAKEEERKEENAQPEQESIVEDSMIADSSVNAEKTEDASAGDDEDSDSEESLPPGLLERPVEILENKRQRKKITRFSYDDEKSSPSVEKKKTLEVPNGSGVRLGDHPRVEYQLQRNTAEDLKIIHRFFYGFIGNVLTCKKNLREFRGFDFEKDSDEYQKKEEIIGKFTVDNLRWAMMVCDIPIVKGIKDDLIDSFMLWCLCPKPQDKPVPEKRKKKDSEQKKKKRTKKSGTKRSSKSIENGDATSDGVTPVKKPRKKKETDGKKKSTKVAKIKISSPKSKAKLDSDESSDDEPLLQKRNSPPSNSEIRKFVENMLKDADLEVLTMKVVFTQVYEQYPEFDLSDRKSFIKETVKKIIS